MLKSIRPSSWGLGPAVLDNVDLNPKNFMGAGVHRLKPFKWTVSSSWNPVPRIRYTS